MKKKEISQEIEDAIVDLYQNVKIRKQEDIEAMDADKLTDERDNLKKASPLTIIKYIKTSIDILIDLKAEERLESIKKKEQQEENPTQDYESLLIKLEADIRQHIRIEHQLKLHSDGLQTRIDELENIEALNKAKIDACSKEKFPISSRRTEGKDKKDHDIFLLKGENANLKQIIKSYEEKNQRFSEMEKNFKNQLLKREQDLKLIEEKYKEKLKVLSRKLLNYDQMINMNSTIKSFKNSSIFKDDEDIVPDHAKSTDRKSQIGSVEKKKRENKIEIYRKMVEKKQNKIDGQKMKTINISQNTIDSEKSSFNLSFLTKDKTIDHDQSKSYTNDIQVNEKKKPNRKHIGSIDIKSHCRQASMEVKSNVLPCDKDKSKAQNMNKTITNIKRTGPKKDETFTTHKPPTNCISSLKQKSNLKKEKSVVSSTMIIHNGEVPCYNNINIYTSNVNQNIKAGDIHLRQYIINQISNKPGN